jgi:hypothetical protein
VISRFRPSDGTVRLFSKRLSGRDEDKFQNSFAGIAHAISRVNLQLETRLVKSSGFFRAPPLHQTSQERISRTTPTIIAASFGPAILKPTSPGSVADGEPGETPLGTPQPSATRAQQQMEKPKAAQSELRFVVKRPRANEAGRRFIVCG